MLDIPPATPGYAARVWSLPRHAHILLLSVIEQRGATISLFRAYMPGARHRSYALMLMRAMRELRADGYC